MLRTCCITYGSKYLCGVEPKSTTGRGCTSTKLDGRAWAVPANRRRRRGTVTLRARRVARHGRPRLSTLASRHLHTPRTHNSSVDVVARPRPSHAERCALADSSKFRVSLTVGTTASRRWIREEAATSTPVADDAAALRLRLLRLTPSDISCLILSVGYGSDGCHVPTGWTVNETRGISLARCCGN
jgi:hypothetical protein